MLLDLETDLYPAESRKYVMNWGGATPLVFVVLSKRFHTPYSCKQRANPSNVHDTYGSDEKFRFLPSHLQAQ